MVLDIKNYRQILRFVFWGAFNTLISIVVYWIFLFVGFPIFVANAIAVFVSVFSGHFFNKNNVFYSTEKRTLRKYCLLWLCFYVISSALIYAFVNLGFNKYLAAVLAGAVLVPASYIVQKLMVFRA